MDLTGGPSPKFRSDCSGFPRESAVFGFPFCLLAYFHGDSGVEEFEGAALKVGGFG